MMMVPMMVYFAVQQLCQMEAVMQAVPLAIRSWLPTVLAMGAFFLHSKYQQAQSAKSTSLLVGKKAPNFDITADGKATNLHQIIKDSPLPTLFDLYQNF